MEKKESLKEQIDTRDKLSAMRNSPGWKMIEDYMSKQLETAMTKLLLATTEREIFYNQAVVIVIKEILEKIGITYKMANNAREELKKYEEI